MTDPSSVLKKGDVLRLQVSPQYATIHILPAPGSSEANDPKFPHHLHNAAELFLTLGMVPQAVQLKDCVDALLERYATNPDGRLGVRLGQACICWQCGYCGIPQDYSTEEDNASKPPGPCAKCQETQQIHWVRVTTPQKGDYLPWIEEAAMTPDQAKDLQAKQAQDLADRRAAVEASVAAALAAREESATEEESPTV